MHHITEDRNGTKWIKNKRLKTSVEFMVPILPIPKLIIDKYSDHLGRQTQGRVIPTICNQNAWEGNHEWDEEFNVFVR